MRTPTLKELCAKATPGPWQDNSIGDFAGAVYQKALAGMAPICSTSFYLKDDEPATEKTHANAQFIARCSPDVMLKVYEALEEVRLFYSNGDFDPTECEPYENLLKAIALLDGQPDSK